MSTSISIRISGCVQNSLLYTYIVHYLKAILVDIIERIHSVSEFTLHFLIQVDYITKVGNSEWGYRRLLFQTQPVRFISEVLFLSYCLNWTFQIIYDSAGYGQSTVRHFSSVLKQSTGYKGWAEFIKGSMKVISKDNSFPTKLRLLKGYSFLTELPKLFSAASRFGVSCGLGSILLLRSHSNVQSRSDSLFPPTVTLLTSPHSSFPLLVFFVFFVALLERGS